MTLDDLTGRVTASAILSDCGTYRYELTRRWGDGELLDWVMLNPSTADAFTDDPTIRRCVGYARHWGFDGIRVTNLFALRATDPAALLTADDPFGDNNQHLRTAVSSTTMCAWGAHPLVHKPGYGRRQWSGLFDRDAVFRCLGVTKNGSPKHPLYMPKTAEPQPWPGANQ